MVRSTLWIIATGYICGSIVALFDNFHLGLAGWLSDLAVHFTPHLALSGVLVSGAMYFAKSRLLFLSTSTLAAIQLLTVLSHENFVEPIDDPLFESASIKVMSANIWEKTSALNKLATLAKQEDVDVIAISEMTQSNCDEISDTFSQFSFCRIVNVAENGNRLSKPMALLSKSEPTSFEVLAEENFRRRAILNVVFKIESQDIRIVVVHPIAPGTPTRMRDRNNVLSAAKQLLENQENFILLGDMNTTTWSRVSRSLPGQRVGDPRLESTWLTNRAMIGLPIDHIRIGKLFAIKNYRVGPSTGSDHRPLIASVYITRP